MARVTINRLIFLLGRAKPGSVTFRKSALLVGSNGG